MFGGIGTLMGASTVIFLPIIYVEQFLKADVADYPRSQNVSMVGVVQGMASMLLVWIYMYTNRHFTDLDMIESIDIDTSISSSVVEEGVESGEF